MPFISEHVVKIRKLGQRVIERDECLLSLYNYCAPYELQAYRMQIKAALAPTRPSNFKDPKMPVMQPADRTAYRRYVQYEIREYGKPFWVLSCGICHRHPEPLALGASQQESKQLKMPYHELLFSSSR